jgi:predicted DNA-binding transcriptional regulator AlpA
MDRLLDQREAARILGVSARTLERLRTTGTGPKFCRFRRLVRYRECDLEEWVRNSVRVSTSENFKRFKERAELSPRNAQRDAVSPESNVIETPPAGREPATAEF